MKKFISKCIFDYKLYWGLRKSIYNFKFRYRSGKHILKDGLKSEVVNGLTLFRTLKSTLRSLALVICIATVMFFVDRWVSPALKSSGWTVPKDGDYVTFLSAVAGIGGVFIGLYYAALTSVGSAIYAKVPNNIRDLLAKERSGSVYMRYLSTLTLLCVTLIACRVIGLPRMLVAVPFIAILAGAGIVAFVKLGKTAFNLFDPTALSYHVFEDFNKAVSITMVNGPHWADPSFQHHAHKLASRSIETLRLLLEITIKETHQNGKPLIQLSCQVLVFLSAYQKFKLKIPSDSNWYPQQFKHRDWYSTMAHSVIVAHKTGTTLQPEMTRSFDWIESQLHADLLRILSITIAQGKYPDVSNLISHLDLYIQTLVACGELEKAFDFSFEISSVIAISIKSPESETSTFKDLERLSIVESVATIPITIALALTKHLERTSLSNMSEALTKIDWRSKKSLYSVGFPKYLLPQGEWLYARMDMELRSEGRLISPEWYRRDILNLALSKALAEQISSFPKRSFDFYTSLSEDFAGYDFKWLRACVQSREYEFLHKADYTLKALIENWEFTTESRALSGLPWPSIQKDELENIIADRKSSLINLIAGQSLMLMVDSVDGAPDYPGQFFFIVGEAFLEALCKNDEKTAGSIFEVYMLGCIGRFERLKPPPGVSAGLEQSYRIAGACLLDLMELSGYAMLLAEFHQNNALWDSVKLSWSNLAAGKAGETIKAYLALVVNLNDGGFGLPLRAELRFEWERRIWSLFNDMPVKEVRKYKGMVMEYRFVHQSPLIRSINVRQMDRLPSGYDLFIVAWYINAMQPQNFKLNWKQAALLKVIQGDIGDEDDEEGEVYE